MTRRGNKSNQALSSPVVQQDPSEDILDEWHCLTWKTDIFHHRVREFNFRSLSLMLELQPKICQSVLYLFLYDKAKSGAKFDTRTYIQDKNGKVVLEQSYKGSLQNGPTVWSLQRDELLSNEDNLLREGIIAFGFEISPCVETITLQQIPAPQSTSNEKMSVPNSTSLEILSIDFSKLYNNEEGSDIVLECGERQIKAHRYILSARSDVFAAMFRSNLSESQEGVVEIQDMIPDTLDRLIWYIYSGKVEDLTMETASQLYETADKYSIESLKGVCVSFLTKNLTQISACDILLLAESHSDEKLEKVVVDFMVKNENVLRTEQFDKFSEEHPLLAIKVCKKYIHSKQPQPFSFCSRNTAIDDYTRRLDDWEVETKEYCKKIINHSYMLK